MSAIRWFSLLLLSTLPLSSGAEVTADDLPSGTVWYLHADIERLRNTASGTEIAVWFDAEVGKELQEETGIDIGKEVKSITAYSDSADGIVILVEGPISKTTQDKLVAMATLEGNIDKREHQGNTYYFASEQHSPDDSGNAAFDDLDDVSYFSFAVNGKAIVTSNEDHLKELLDNNGRIAGSKSHDSALFVLTADVSFVQAGLMTHDLIEAGSDDDWESNIIRNTEQAAVLIADQDGQIVVEAQLMSKDPKMTQSIGGIVNGLISLQAFNSDLPPEIRSLIDNTRVVVDGAVLKINTVIAPAVIGALLND
jgi:hypothetical protein